MEIEISKLNPIAIYDPEALFRVGIALKDIPIPVNDRTKEMDVCHQLSGRYFTESIQCGYVPPRFLVV